MTGIYSSHPIFVNTRGLRPRQRFALSEDDGSDKSSESNSNTPLFFSAGPGDSSAEPEETDSEDDNGYTENERA